MITSNLLPFPASFRDYAGQVLAGENCVYRKIDASYAEHWKAAAKSGFFNAAIKKGLLIPFKESPSDQIAWKMLQSPKIAFISYPYEWCFGQLKTAALHTLDILDEALSHGLILRDATAYNIQFEGWKSTFIDLLSFEPYLPGFPWQAYGQFCRFFLGPLALMAHRSPLCGRFLRDWIEGLPFELITSLLPFTTRFSPSLGLHLHYHSRLQAKFSDPRKAAKKIKKIHLSDKAVPNLSKALRLAVEAQKLPANLSTEWGDYYNDTNYSLTAAESKKKELNRIVASLKGEKELAIDLGANTAFYSSFLANIFSLVIAADIDYLAIEKLWLYVCEKKISNLLPLVMDLCNPSPALGWDNIERDSFKQRCKADFLSALAVVHHLVFTGGISLPVLATGLSHLLKDRAILVLEWVPLEDSQVQRLLAARTTPHLPYSYQAFLDAFIGPFKLIKEIPIAESLRILTIFCKEGC